MENRDRSHILRHMHSLPIINILHESWYIYTVSEPTVAPIIMTPNLWLTLPFTLGAACSVGFDSCIMI